MKNIYYKMLVVITVILSFCSCTDKEVVCDIKGETAGRNSDTIFLVKKNRIVGAKLNREFKTFSEKMDSIFKPL